LEQFWHAFTSRGFDSVSWAFLFTSMVRKASHAAARQQVRLNNTNAIKAINKQRSYNLTRFVLKQQTTTHKVTLAQK